MTLISQSMLRAGHIRNYTIVNAARAESIDRRRCVIDIS
jgi:hypothetical protein